MGSTGSDYLTEEDIDHAKAVEKALESAGFDMAFGVGGQVVKGAFVMGRKALGFTPKETADDIIREAREGLETGSRESLQATQRLLQEKGAGLSVSQTGQANPLQIFMEKIGASGILSEQASLAKIQRVNEAAREHLTDLIETGASRGGATRCDRRGVIFCYRCW